MPKEKYYIMDYRPGTGLGNEELETIQAGMLELVMPVLPHRLNDDWRKVIEQMDFLDVPGMRAVRTGIEQGKHTEANTLEEQMEISNTYPVPLLARASTNPVLLDVAAMANANTKDDHVMVVGLSEAGVLQDAPLPEDEAKLQQRLQAIEQIPHVRFSTLRIEGHTISTIEIHEPFDKPYVARSEART